MTKKSHLTLLHTSLWNKGDADVYLLISQKLVKSLRIAAWQMLSIFSRISHQQDFNYSGSSFTRFPDELIGRLSFIHSWKPKMSARVETALCTTSTLKCCVHQHYLGFFLQPHIQRQQIISAFPCKREEWPHMRLITIRCSTKLYHAHGNPLS